MQPSISHELEGAIAAASVAMFVGSLVAVPVFLMRMRDDYFVRGRPPHSLVWRFFTTLLGLALVALGIAMLVLPGQGILTILVGLAILELPFKDRVIARLLNHPKVSAAIDRLRRKAGKGPLLVPGCPPPSKRCRLRSEHPARGPASGRTIFGAPGG